MSKARVACVIALASCVLAGCAGGVVVPVVVPTGASQPTLRTASAEVEDACIAATRIEANADEAVVVASEGGETTSTVALTAGAGRWQCVSANDGLVSSVTPV